MQKRVRHNRHLIRILSTTLGLLPLLIAAPANADDLSDYNKCYETAVEQSYKDREVALNSFQKALRLADKLKPADKARAEHLKTTERLGHFYSANSRYEDAEKCFREVIRAYEADKSASLRDLSYAYSSLSTACGFQGKTEEGETSRLKSLELRKTFDTIEKQRNEAREFAQLKHEFDGAMKTYGASTWSSFLKGKRLAQWYIKHDQFDKAVPLCEGFLAYTENSKNYFDLGAEWDQRHIIPNRDELDRQQGFLDDRRPSAKLNERDLINCLVVLSELQKKQGNTERAEELLSRAKKVYFAYSIKNPLQLFQPFEQFVQAQSHNTCSSEPKLVALLNWNN